MKSIGKNGMGLARAFRAGRNFEWAVLLVLWVASWFVMSVVPFLRHKFGERYLGWLNLYFGYGAISLFIFIGPGLIPLTGGSPHYWMGVVSIPMLIAWALFVIVSLCHRFEIWQRNREGEAWHSWSMGTSVFREIDRNIPDELIHKWIEPVVVLAMGMLFVLISRQVNTETGEHDLAVAAPVGVWLIISSVCLWVHSRIVYHFERQQLLDTRDAQIEAQFLTAALAGKPAYKTAGFVIAHSTVEAVRKDPGLKAAFEGLGREMNAVLATPEAA